MAMTNINVTVTKAEIVKVSSPRPIYKRDGEMDFHRLECQGVDAEGVTVYFSSPVVETRVSCPPRATIALVMYDFPGRSGDWLGESEGRKWADSQGPNENRLLAKIGVGDALALRCEVAEKIAQRTQRPYLAAKRVQILERTPRADRDADEVYGVLALAGVV